MVDNVICRWIGIVTFASTRISNCDGEQIDATFLSSEGYITVFGDGCLVCDLFVFIVGKNYYLSSNPLAIPSAV